MNLFIGVVEDRDSDPLKLGRCRVRVSGLHTENKSDLPTHDLPWLTPIVPASGAMSGIGDSPVGFVEGTVVLVGFMDEHNQNGFILGSINGLPSSGITTQASQTTVQQPLTSGSGTVVTDSFGNPIGTGASEQTEEQQQSVKRPPRTMEISQAGIDKIKQYERLSSVVRGQNVPARGDVSDNTLIFSYQDVGGVWTIGWGNVFLADGSRVNENTVLTKKQCDDLFKIKLAEFVSSANRRITVPVTQGMFDAVVSMMYNAGAGGIGSSKFMSSLNAGRYREAATLIVETRSTVNGQPSRGIRNRREAERALFLSDGLLELDGTSTPAPITSTQQKETTDVTKNPVIRKNQEFRSADSTTVNPIQNPNTTPGFQDPHGKYPLQDWIGEPDVHRLARHEDIENTIVFSKDSSRVTSVKKADGTTWDQPPVPYNAKYPFNATRVSQSGHIEEWDDTPGNERLHRWHKSGTYEEIDVNGTVVRRIMGDDYEILERNGRVLIKGSCDVTIKGNSTVRVENNATIEVLGNATTKVSGNYELSVGGTIKMKSAAGIFLDSDSNIDVVAAGNIRNDGSTFHMNTGNAIPSGTAVPTESAPGLPEFAELNVPQRSGDIKAVYELPEDGDPTEFLQEQVKNGSILEEDIAPVPAETKEEVKVATKPPAEAVVTGCDVIFQTQEFTSAFRLTQNFTLGQVCQGRSGIPRGTNYGLTAQEIICNLKTLTENVIEPVYAMYPGMIITNTFRSQAVNDSLRGASKTSAHLSGQAVDFVIPGFTRRQLWQAAQDIQKALPQFDQMLLEYLGNSMWIHIAFKTTGNRNEVRTIVVNDRSKNANGRFVLYDGF